MEVLQFTLFLLAAILSLYYFFSNVFNHWKRQGIPSLPLKFPFGNLKDVFLRRRCLGEVLQDIYTQFKEKGVKFGGFYIMARPVFCPIDVELIKNIILTDFQHFHDRDIYHDESFDPLSANLFAVDGEQWKRLRKMLTPTFTSGKMKSMTSKIVDCSKQLEHVLGSGSGSIDVRDVASRFTTDVIGSCAFGVTCNSFENPDAEFIKYGKKVVEMSPVMYLKTVLFLAVPGLMKALRVPFNCQDTSEFFLTLVRDVVEHREKNGLTRNDFMDLLIGMRKKLRDGVGGEGEELSLEQLAAQVFIFFLAGFETSSSTVTFCLYELAKNPGMQERLRTEIRRILKDNQEEMTYQGLQDMVYLEMVILETLRKYPIFPMLFRKCTKDYQIPGSQIVIRKDTKVMVPLLGLQRDPEFFPNPLTFDPERFSEENKDKIRPFTFMPFGDGLRNCIGRRFGMLQTKIGLVAFLKNHEYILGRNAQTSMKLDPGSYLLSPKETILLKYRRLS